MDGSTAVRVFVDDAVQGRFPRVCARTGLPSDGWLSVDAIVGRSRSMSTTVIVLLILFGGPLGWIVVLLFSPSQPTDRLRVELPWTVDTQAEVVALRQRRRLAWIASAAGAAVAFALVLTTVGGAGWTMSGRVVLVTVVVGAIGAAAVALATEWQIGRRTVGVDLDASRRWVTLSNVHPNFARAVRAGQQRRAEHQA
ncbi:MAG TPA: hypothetical protein VFY82_02200 [Acidimicrobiales bacterium]|nr:hypothetical protein [Acidimicrobiales bacterium]